MSVRVKERELGLAKELGLDERAAAILQAPD
jgi:hypothetical protein